MTITSGIQIQSVIMKIKVYCLLALIGIIPVIASILLRKLYASKKTEKLTYMQKQIIAGLIFGVIAIIGTEFGVPYEGTVINARDAAPLCAGLIFGTPAGIISGFIGGIERWFSVYWGAGTYTRLACSISTCLSGFIAAGLRKYMFDDHTPPWGFAVVIGAMSEVIHMLMIFITNTGDISAAFNYVQVCTGPMVVVNSAAAGLAVYALSRIKEQSAVQTGEKHIPSISRIFQQRLIWTVFAAYIITFLFTYSLQTDVSRENTMRMFFQNLADAATDLTDQCNDSMQKTAQIISDHIKSDAEVNLTQLKQRYEVGEINIVDEEDNIIRSSEDGNVGKLFNSDYGFPSITNVMRGNENAFSGISDYYKNLNDVNSYMKCAYVSSSNGTVLITWDEDQVSDTMRTLLPGVVSNRHLGESGGLIVLDEDLNTVCATNGLIYNMFTEKNREIVFDQQDMKPGELYTCRIDGVPFYYMYSEAGYYDMASVLPVAEADLSKMIAVYLNFFMLTIIFGTLFVLIYLIIKYLIVGNIRKVNQSLAAITDGNLDTVVDVRSSREFDTLSNDINSTVDTLKNYIAEANARIDTELKYAREIQFNALPKVFPEREEIDLYALTRPAKEVGGDFYDFYFLNKNTLVFLVADVSGKGIPASLFMMRAKTILKSFAENKLAVQDIFTNANYQLCDGNETAMFVTSWMGILNLETGELKYVNAGHNRPLVKRHDGAFEYLKGPAGFVLAGMEGIAYKAQSLTLVPGDEIFLYTDGVVEANDPNGALYGEERLQNCLNSHTAQNAAALCREILADVDRFNNGASQYDDITELSLKFLKYSKTGL